MCVVIVVTKPFISAPCGVSDIVNVIACHAEDRGPIPGGPKSFFSKKLQYHVLCTYDRKIIFN